MKATRTIALLLAMAMVGSCHEEVITVNLDTASPRLVIDASIDWIKGTSGSRQTIKLTTTAGYYEEGVPAVTGAEVFVTNSSNTVFDFVEIPGSGEYVCSDFIPTVGEVYTLDILLGGERYTASETLVGVPDIEERVEQYDKGGMDGKDIELTFYFQDNGHEYNYYLYSFITDCVAYPQYEVEDNEMTSGNLTQVYYSHEDMRPGDGFVFKLYGISKRYHDYMAKIILASSGDSGGMFPATPGEVRGNIINMADSRNYPYGYFRLSEVDRKEYTVK